MSHIQTQGIGQQQGEKMYLLPDMPNIKSADVVRTTRILEYHLNVSQLPEGLRAVLTELDVDFDGLSESDCLRFRVEFGFCRIEAQIRVGRSYRIVELDRRDLNDIFDFFSDKERRIVKKRIYFRSGRVDFFTEHLCGLILAKVDSEQEKLPRFLSGARQVMRLYHDQLIHCQSALEIMY